MILLAVLGLWLPGYVLARALRAPMAWAAAFPLSAVLLTEIVIVCAVLGIAIRFEDVFAAVVVISLVAGAVWFLRRRWESDVVEKDEMGNDAPRSGGAKTLCTLVAVLVGLILLGVFVRSFLFPLTGVDTPYRWDGLARLMLKYESLSYYPPVSAEDFAKYLYPDGIPPLTSTVYWWLYAAGGEPCPAITSVAVLLQVASCFALVYCGARIFFGPAAGWVALGTLASSSLFLSGVLIGQETGYTAISYAGQLAFALAAVRKPKAGLVVIAGLFAAIGALAREYGPLLSLCGFVVLVWQRETRRYLPLFCLVAAVCGAPWYFRNWMLTGNPVYPMNIFGFPGNSALTGVMAGFWDFYGANTFSLSQSIGLAVTLLKGGSLAAILGIAGIMYAGRKAFSLGISAAVIVVLWLWSISYTIGGVEYSLRVLTPAWVALSIGAGTLACWFAGLREKTRKTMLAIASLAVVIWGGYANLICWSHPPAPIGPPDLLSAITSTRKDPLDLFESSAIALAKDLEDTNLPPGGILTDDAYLGVALQRYSKFRPVMVWSPAVRFVFDRQLEPSQIRNRLVKDGIWCVSMDFGSPHNAYLCQFPFFYDFFRDRGVSIKELVEKAPPSKLIFPLVPDAWLNQKDPSPP